MLRKYLNTYFQDIELKHIFNDVIGIEKPEKIQLLVDKEINKHIQSSIQNILFIQSSIGVVFGFLLTNKKKIILKVYSKKIDKSYLDSMNHVQGIFHEEGFPAPAVLSPIFKFGTTYAGLYECIDGKKEDAHKSEIRKELAKYLARFSEIIDKHHLPPLHNFFQLSAKNSLWPTPHNVLFNLNKTSPGAGWIAKKALKAKQILTSAKLEKRLAHTDWGVKNAIFRSKKLVGIFDWDSLGAMSEPEMVGRAAAQFTADWESPFKITPSAEEARSFVKDYEKYRRKKFTNEEYKIISASTDYLIAIIARFEHAGGNPSNQPYQNLLRQCGKKSFLLQEF